VIAVAGILAWVWKGGKPADTGKSSLASIRTEAPAQPAAVVVNSLPPGTNADPAQSAAEVFKRRYGLGAFAPPGSVTNGASPEEAFRRRYGLGHPSFLARRQGTNAAFTGIPAESAPSRFNGRRATNDTTGVTSRGPVSLAITQVTPLYLKLTLDSVMVTDSGPRFVIGVQKEADDNPRNRVKKQYYCSLNDSGNRDTFTLREVKAPPDNPTNATLVLELKGSGERVSISKDHPFQWVEGYAADLAYAPENKAWAKQRIGSVLAVGGEELQIIALTRTVVVLQAKSNGKAWTLEYKGAPENQTGAVGAGDSPKQP
jgi:hypothetical protein